MCEFGVIFQRPFGIFPSSPSSGSEHFFFVFYTVTIWLLISSEARTQRRTREILPCGCNAKKDDDIFSKNRRHYVANRNHTSVFRVGLG